jgi:hypothetical protein
MPENTTEPKQRSADRIHDHLLRKRFGAALAAALAVLTWLAASPPSGAALSAPDAAASSVIAPCQLPHLSARAARRVSLHVRGNRVMTGDGRRFAFYGLSVFGGLQDGDGERAWRSTIPSSLAQIEAASRWHANTIRIQLAEASLFQHTHHRITTDPRFLAAICQQVRLARSEGLQVVLNDQTEFPDWWERNPTARTLRFWDVIAREYANQPGISFDLFNEPRLYFKTRVSRRASAQLDGFQTSVAFPTVVHGGRHRLTMNPGWIWHLWRRGGKAGGIRFVGMQTLVDEVRRMGIRNPLWIEGPFFDSDLTLANRYPIKGRNLIWSVHHPAFGSTSASSQQLWNTRFGNLARRVPVVDGEWSQFASPKHECHPNAYTMAPIFLRYLRAHHISLVAWSLQPGSLVRGPRRRLPTNLTKSWDTIDAAQLLKPSRLLPDYACDRRHAGQGAGQLVWNYFHRNDTSRG